LQWDEELIAAYGLTGISFTGDKAIFVFHLEKTTLNGLFKTPVPVTALIGDSHAAAFGEGCFEAGTAKGYYGNGLQYFNEYR
jgi:glycerol kinase